jgi:hypothetical protein
MLLHGQSRFSSDRALRCIYYGIRFILNFNSLEHLAYLMVAFLFFYNLFRCLQVDHKAFKARFVLDTEVANLVLKIFAFTADFCNYMKFFGVPK